MKMGLELALCAGTAASGAVPAWQLEQTDNIGASASLLGVHVAAREAVPAAAQQQFKWQHLDSA